MAGEVVLVDRHFEKGGDSPDLAGKIALK